MVKFGVICGRSWIGKALIDSLGPAASVYPKYYTDDMAKSWCELDALFLIAGRVRPSDAEKIRERELIMRVMYDVPYGLRVVYMSSSEAGRDTDYGRHKLHCESLIIASPKSNDWVITRPPAIFGPGQPVDSEMLIPSLARTDGDLALSNPDIYREYAYIDDVVEYLIDVGTHGHTGISLGSLRATARDMQRLYLTWKGYRQD